MTDEPGVIGVGYQGLAIDQFIRSLEDMRITRVVDVRLTPLSRKPGFSKTRLAQALPSHSISYEHVKALGNPKDNRQGFTGDAEQLEIARWRYIRTLDVTDAWTLLDDLTDRAQTERVALLCFEAETGRCHRQVLLEEVRSRCVLRHAVSA
jgi:uncharacterized protein (DUF488 family)